MGYWNSMGLKGSGFEEMINFTNDFLQKRGAAVIQKIPTPITPVEMSKDKRTITLAYFDKKSTVDYIGVASGVALAFDAKETTQKSLPLQNVHEHQIEFMKSFRDSGGVSFLIVSFVKTGEIFILPFEVLEEYHRNALAGGRKSIPYSAFEQKYTAEIKMGGIIDFITPLNVYLAEIQKEKEK
ncbi:MAG: Holliday junction resolvase RecU [Firmicutes bacterium]|nr:Holliday junction resolvase RecU [Bacillota bacterium]